MRCFNELLDIANEAVGQRHALQKPRELARFLEVMQACDPKVIYEIGTSLGGLLWAMAVTLRGSRTFVVIDLPNGPFGGSRISTEEIGYLALAANPHCTCIVIRGDSKEVELPDEQPDFVIIDGDHTADGVWADWNRYSPLVKQGGVIALHDIAEHPSETGVQVNSVWEKVKNKAEKWDEIIEADTGPWAGIGLIWKDTLST